MTYCGYFGDQVDTIDHLEQLLEDSSSGLDHPAAVIVETVQGEGGVNVASFEWLKRLEKLCKRHDMLLIVDDIQVGCGRTGSFFSFEGAQIQPDIITLSKSLSGYGLPMALVLMKPEYDVWRVGAHNGTFRGNNLAFVTATETLKKFWKQEHFQDEVERKGIIIKSWLQHISEIYPEGQFSVRGRGMMRGLHSDQPELIHRIAEMAFEHGVVIETSGSRDDVLKILAPLIISDELLRKGLSILESCVAKALSVSTRPKKNVRPLKSIGGAS
jgi:diaminobutyrate-2-oxoglutarate transaminase